jgi:uncharacterized membrane protein
LYLACIAIALAQAGVDGLRTIGDKPSSLMMLAFGVGLSLALTFLVSRLRSRIAMWVLVAFFVLGLPSDVANLTESESNVSIALTLLRALVELAALGFLFTPAARGWFRRIPDDRMLQKTFS